MTLKQEIQKLVETERQKLTRRDERQREHSANQFQRFEPLKTLLVELVESFPKSYIEASFRDTRARISIGRRQGSHLSADFRWEIAPAGLFTAEPGFRVEETQYFRMPEYEIAEHRYNFSDESKVIEYLAEKCSEKVAFYDHLAAKSAERSGKSRSGHD